jgi:16S rRNA C1402 (ribose-2'-O) methylase RsmI
VSPEELVGDVLKLVATGMRLKEAVAEIAQQNSVSKSVLYQLALDAKQ